MSDSFAKLPNCPNRDHAGTDANPCDMPAPNGYCSWSMTTTGRLGKPGSQGTGYGSGNVHTASLAPLATGGRFQEWLSGHIHHALYTDYWCSDNAGGATTNPVFPATEGGGSTALTCQKVKDEGWGFTWTYRPPNGALIFLDYTDSELDCLNPEKAPCPGITKLPILQFEFLEAYTYYGGYLGDTGTGNVQLTLSTHSESGYPYWFYSAHGYPAALAGTDSWYSRMMDYLGSSCYAPFCQRTSSGSFGPFKTRQFNLFPFDNVPVIGGKPLYQHLHFADPCVARALAGQSGAEGACR
jgi:hypothetical protein